MFEILVNLVLMSLFLQSQVKEQVTLDNLINFNNPAPQVQAAETIHLPQRVINTDSVGVELTAKSVLVVDETTNKILYENNSSEIRSIASVTKLMTALVFMDNNPGLNARITIESSDYREGAIDYLVAGEAFTAYDVLSAALITSSNEGAVALSRSTQLTPEEFIIAMNEKAKELGMLHSNFVDVAGLQNGNRSNTRDLILLYREALNNQELSNIISRGSYNLNILNKGITRTIYSTDRILGQSFGTGNKIYRVESGKTGYLDEAGYCFISRVKNQDGNRVLVVVLGSETINDRFLDTKALAYWVFKNYIWN